MMNWFRSFFVTPAPPAGQPTALDIARDELAERLLEAKTYEEKMEILDSIDLTLLASWIQDPHDDYIQRRDMK